MYRLQRRRRTAVFYDREHERNSTLEPLQVFFTFVMAHGCYERSNGQRERRHLVILFQHNLTAANLAEDPAFVPFTRLQSKYRICRAVEKDPETFFVSGDGADKQELRAFGFRRFLRLRWQHVRRRSGGASTAARHP